MSDEFSQCCARFREAIRVTGPDIRFDGREKQRRIIFTLEIPYPFFKDAHKIVQEGIACCTDNSGENSLTGSNYEKPSSSTTSPKEDNASSSSVAKQFTYIDLVEKCTFGECFAFSDDPNIRREIDSALMKIAYNISLQYKNTKGRARKELDERVWKFHVMEGQAKTIQEFYNKMESLHDEIGILHDELQEWKSRCKNLEEEKEKIYEEMVLEAEQSERKTQSLQEENKELEDYIKSLEKSLDISSFKGNTLSQVKNKSRTLKTFLSRAQTALWFANSFGIELESLSVKESDTGVIHKVSCLPNSSSSLSQSSEGEDRYSSLSEDQKRKVEQILFLLDKFCVGDSFYHEISMITDSLPRSYLVKQCREQLNKMCHIEALDGNFEGGKVSSVETVFKEHISDFLKQNPDFDTVNDKIKIKINGDGARMTRNSNFILLSFSILQTGESVMSAKGNRTIGIVNGTEGYQTIKVSFASLIKEINSLIESAKLTVDAQDLNTEFYLGGDYKFILLMLGLKGATSNYACAWCKVHKADHWNISDNYLIYNTPPMVRTLEEIREMSTTSKDNYCCDKQPLLNIPLDHIVVDELHLMLRVTDILIENLVNECLDWDREDDLNKKKGEAKGAHLKNLIQVIRSCGVSFDVWEQKNADGKASGRYDWTSLLGSDKKILLADLPSKLINTLRPETVSTVVEVWTAFADIYKVVSNWNPEKKPKQFFMKAKQWISLFLSLNGKREGYKKNRITPYMHIMVTHIPRFFELHKSVKIFTGQGVEKNNDMARGIILRKSNKWDSAGDVLRQERRQWELKEHEREVRNYTKRKESYWNVEIKETRKRAKINLTEHLQQPSEAPTQSTSSDTDFSKMTVKELKN